VTGSTPDREAAVSAVAKAIVKEGGAISYHFLTGRDGDENRVAEIAIDALLPLLLAAREDGVAEGRRKAAEAIEAEREPRAHPFDEGMRYAADLARQSGLIPDEGDA
jgi:hypothetical protein